MKSKISILIVFVFLIVFNYCDNTKDILTVNELIPKELIGWHRVFIPEYKSLEGDSTIQSALLYLRIDYGNTAAYYIQTGYFFYGLGFLANKENEEEMYETIVANLEDKKGERKHFIIKYPLDENNNYKVFLDEINGQPDAEFSKIENQVTESSFLLDAKNSLKYF